MCRQAASPTRAQANTHAVIDFEISPSPMALDSVAALSEAAAHHAAAHARSTADCSVDSTLSIWRSSEGIQPQLSSDERALNAPTVSSSIVSGLPAVSALELNGAPTGEECKAAMSPSAGPEVDVDRTIQNIESAAARFFSSQAQVAAQAASSDADAGGVGRQHDPALRHFLMGTSAASVADSAPLSEGEIRRLLHAHGD
jgi:hypothetical protein